MIVAIGTPKTLDTIKPAITIDAARGRFSTDTRAMLVASERLKHPAHKIPVTIRMETNTL